MIVAPSMLAADKNNLKGEITRINASKAEWIHLDIMDGKFVPNTSFDENFVRQTRKQTKKFLDVHLMTFHPEELLNLYKDAGANLITFHFEAVTNPFSIIEKIKALGLKVGISLKPKTMVKDIESYLSAVDVVLVMSVEPGAGGQKFLPIALSKIEELKKIREKKQYHYLIEVDGGINNETAPLVKKAGCDVVVSGSFLFKAPSFLEAVEEIL